MSHVTTAQKRISTKVDIALGFLIQLLYKKMLSVRLLKWSRMSYSNVFVSPASSTVAGTPGGGGGSSNVSWMCEWRNCQEICICLDVHWLLPRPQDCGNLTDPGAIHPVCECCQPAHGSHREQLWFMLPVEPAREAESSIADLFIAEPLEIE